MNTHDEAIALRILHEFAHTIDVYADVFAEQLRTVGYAIVDLEPGDGTLYRVAVMRRVETTRLGVVFPGGYIAIDLHGANRQEGAAWFWDGKAVYAEDLEGFVPDRYHRHVTARFLTSVSRHL